MLPIVMFKSSLKDLLKQNAVLMDQAGEVLARIPGALYCKSSIFGGQRIGAQIRHIVEFYDCLFEGIERGRVNYDARRRDPVIESDRLAAIERIRAIRERLLSDAFPAVDFEVLIAPEGGADADFASSLGRELQAVGSHTVHHFALIAMLLAAAGVDVPANFGVSRATMKYRAEADARAEAA
jgi:hypothetical protein